MFTATDLLDQLFPDCYCSCQRCYYQLDFLLVLVFAVLTWFQEQLKQDESVFPAVSDRRVVVYEPNQRKLIKPNLKLNLEESDDEDIKDEDEEEEDRNNNSLSTVCADAIAGNSDLSEPVDYNLNVNYRVNGSSSQVWNESGNVSSENYKEVKEIGTQTEPDLSAVNGDICLNFKELKQMRRAVTKLELLTNSRFKAKEDLLRGKICYNCSKTKFKFFGPWSTKCKLCKKLMCSNCLEYARVSTRRHNKIPLQLSPVDNENKAKIAKRYELMSKSVQALNTQRVDGSLEELSRESKLKRSSSINWFKSSPPEGGEDNCFTKMKMCKDCQIFLINCFTQQS